MQDGLSRAQIFHAFYIPGVLGIELNIIQDGKGQKGPLLVFPCIFCKVGISPQNFDF